ncbi:hypothetical protein AVEN_76916-1 [Araneus ventricosus]|uniref:Uncharacterized protein n=1 Tax=Araneus ventricosus TaxID=182803 RepID=A0A4Y2LJX3_ARAVE|nr:hypothetical protein AVEN_76916-1 [Araneus ventricosus]
MALSLPRDQRRLERIERELSMKLASYAHCRQYIAYLMGCEPTDKIKRLEKDSYARMNELEIAIPQIDGKWHDLKKDINELHDFLFNDDRECDANNEYMPHDNCDHSSCCKDYDSDMSTNVDDIEKMHLYDGSVNNPVLPVNNIISNDKLVSDNVLGNS